MGLDAELVGLTPYRYPLNLRTAHGLWADREGLRLRLRLVDGREGYGEIAPIPWFGTETLEVAIATCAQLPRRLTWETIHTIPDTCPATQFAFEAAWLDALGLPELPNTLRYSQLLPAGAAALTRLETAQAASTYKWKIGVYPWPQEQAWLEHLLQQLPETAKLRLDANGSLSRATLLQLLNWLEQSAQTAKIELIEQPLADPDQIRDIAATSSVAIAIDESVSTLADLERWRDWPGPLVIKPAITGFPSQLRQRLQTHHQPIILSSALETQRGQQLVLALTHDLSERALGFAPQGWFNEAAPSASPAPDRERGA